MQLVQLLADFGRNDQLYTTLMGSPPDQLRLVSQVFYRPDFRQFRGFIGFRSRGERRFEKRSAPFFQVVSKIHSFTS